MLRRPALVGVAIALVVPLTACTQATRLPEAEPSSEVAPLFSSDEEALAAATAAYEEYLAVLDAVLQAPASDEGLLERVARGQALISAQESIAEFVEDQLRLSAPRVVGGAELQQHRSSGTDAEVTTYFCEDISGVVLLDASGNSLSEASRPDYTVFEATVEFDIDGAFVIEREFWSNEQSC